MRALMLIPLLALLACSPPGAERRAFLSQFVGKPEGDLVMALGVPERTYESQGVRFLAFVESRVDFVPAVSFYGPAFWSLAPTYPAGVTQWYCETTVAVRDNIVQSFTFRGNAC